jgi:signal transduction histidine kinase
MPAAPHERTDGSVRSSAHCRWQIAAALPISTSPTHAVERALRERSAALETPTGSNPIHANVSYELRTPLNAIIGFSEILHQQYFGTLNERQIDYSQGIMDASQQLLSLINDILDIATIEAGYLQLSGPECRNCWRRRHAGCERARPATSTSIQAMAIRHHIADDAG